MIFEERFGVMIITCLSNKGTRPGEFIIGKNYRVFTDDVLIPYIKGDNGTEYEYNVVKDLFTKPISIGEYRNNQIDKLL